MGRVTPDPGGIMQYQGYKRKDPELREIIPHFSRLLHSLTKTKCGSNMEFTNLRRSPEDPLVSGEMTQDGFRNDVAHLYLPATHLARIASY